MTPRELNRDVKKLNSNIKNFPKEDLTAYFKYIDKEAKPEFIRLIGADNTFKSFTADSLRILIRLNLSHRFVAFHTFGLFIEI